LLLLASLSVVSVVEFLGEYGPVALYNASPIIYGIFAVIAIAGKWVMVSRRGVSPDSSTV
jgi:hypothetical protein